MHGGSLKTVNIRSRPVGYCLALTLGLDVLLGVAHLHEQKLVWGLTVQKMPTVFSTLQGVIAFAQEGPPDDIYLDQFVIWDRASVHECKGTTLNRHSNRSPHAAER